jgi:hypothetical protein
MNLRQYWPPATVAVKYCRWQSAIVYQLMTVGGWRRWSTFDQALKCEAALRRLLGQKLSPSRWSQMTFNDKVTYRRLFVKDPLYQVFSDRLRMRDFVANRVGSEVLPRMLAVGQRVEDVEDLRGPFVLKANHGSGMVVLVDDGVALSKDQRNRAESWLSVDYSWDEIEWGYSGARRLLLVEEFLPGSDGDRAPTDYKIFTFDGRPEMIAACLGRFEDHRVGLRRPDWSAIAGRWGPAKALKDEVPPPANLDVMLNIAARLGREIDMVRVDLYDLGNRVVVGELTPYPGAGYVGFLPRSLDAWLGTFWPEPGRRGGPS